ncbi:50S ribosomal protein L18 [Candidatus Blochmannia ocreatus (nom. nud.)]|uniref:Large ribosomal subunit protein uL18 n=1 Tax=Candidatus Blochmannia ocreatus (nom. nud.) TaxID=251538 RepID=A0ABY4SV33_9ENTR|nr:50S ribosomal protein L18 [Candidatus Blochmannia ocreatus]URJ25284.1 50S ribosomal protein L18 [Candidatus Blochmannia ocreatus]
MNKKNARIKRAKKTRKKLCKLDVTRLAVYRTSRHIYAQIISKDNSKTLVAASTMEQAISKQLHNSNTGNKNAAAIVGQKIAERAIKKGIIDVSFDRSGFKYHGRIKMLADSARKFGLKF